VFSLLGNAIAHMIKKGFYQKIHFWHKYMRLCGRTIHLHFPDKICRFRHSRIFLNVRIVDESDNMSIAHLRDAEIKKLFFGVFLNIFDAI